MLERLADDSAFNVPLADLESAIDATRFVGRAPQQVDEFLAQVVEPLLARRSPSDELAEEVRV